MKNNITMPFLDASEFGFFIMQKKTILKEKN